MNALVRYEFADGVATLAMDDGKANVMSVAMLAALNDALDRAEQEARAVVLRGREGTFSGGFDLAAFKRGGPEVLTMLETGARLCERLLGYPLPVIAACTGHAIAMGAFILLSTDLRIGVNVGARFQVNEVRIGMTVPHFAIEACRKRLAPAQLHAATTLGQPMTKCSRMRWPKSASPSCAAQPVAIRPRACGPSSRNGSRCSLETDRPKEFAGPSHGERIT